MLQSNGSLLYQAKHIWDLQTSGCYFRLVTHPAANSYVLSSENIGFLSETLALVDQNQGVFTTIYNLQYALLCFMVIFNVIGFYISYKAYQEYGWNQYQTQGASIERKRVNRWYQFFIILLKLNIFFFASILAQFMTSFYFASKFSADVDVSRVDISWATLIITVVSVLYYFLGFFGTQRQSFLLMGIFIGLMIVQLGGLLWIMFAALNSDYFKPTRMWLTTFTAIQLIVDCITMAVGSYLTAKFGILREIGKEK